MKNFIMALSNILRILCFASFNSEETNDSSIPTEPVSSQASIRQREHHIWCMKENVNEPPKVFRNQKPYAKNLSGSETDSFDSVDMNEVRTDHNIDHNSFLASCSATGTSQSCTLSHERNVPKITFPKAGEISNVKAPATSRKIRNLIAELEVRSEISNNNQSGMLHTLNPIYQNIETIHLTILKVQKTADENAHVFQQGGNSNPSGIPPSSECIVMYSKKSDIFNREETSDNSTDYNVSLNEHDNIYEDLTVADDVADDVAYEEILYSNLNQPSQDDSHVSPVSVSDIVKSFERSGLLRENNSGTMRATVPSPGEGSNPCEYEREELGIAHRNAANSETSSSIPLKRRIICDKYGNVRIQKYMQDNNLPEVPEMEEKPPKEGIDGIVKELIVTGAKYVSDMELVIQVYKPYLDRLSASYPELADKSSPVFGNIESIYEGTKKFYKNIEQFSNSIIDIGETFLEFKSLFELYPLYAKNKSTSEVCLVAFEKYLVKKQKELNDCLGLHSHLLTPIQRLGKYTLFLENVLKCQPIKNTKAEIVIQEALKLVKSEMRKANDLIAIDSIKKCPFDLLLQGACLMSEKFILFRKKKKELMVFLFEKIVVFTTADQNVEGKFIYYEAIPLSDLSTVFSETDPFAFHLIDFQRNLRCKEDRYTFVLKAADKKTKQQWIKAISGLLMTQLEKLRSEQSRPSEFKYKSLTPA